MNEVEELQRRVLQLEELFSHHEQLVQHLNKTLVDLRAEHDKLRVQFGEQRQRLVELAESQATPMDPDERPPHY